MFHLINQIDTKNSSCACVTVIPEWQIVRWLPCIISNKQELLAVWRNPKAHWRFDLFSLLLRISQVQSNCKGTNKSITSHPYVAVLWYIFSLVTHYSLRIEIRAHGNMRKREVWSSTMSQPRSCFSGGEVKMLKFLSWDENEIVFLWEIFFLEGNMWNASLTWGGLKAALFPQKIVPAPAGDKRTFQHSATDSQSRCISTRLILSLFYSISTSMLYAQQERRYVHMYSNIKNALTGALFASYWQLWYRLFYLYRTALSAHSGAFSKRQ